MVRWVMLVIVAAAAALVWHAAGMPSYTDPSVKRAWDSKAADRISAADRDGWDEFEKEYWRAVGATRTGRRDFMDLGLGVGMLSATLLVISFPLRARRLSDWLKVQSPKRAGWFFLWGNLFWLTLIPGGFVIYTFRQLREDYPWFSDSIAIPIFGQAILVVVTLPLVNLFFLALARAGAHPARLVCRLPGWSAGAVIHGIMYGLLGAVGLLKLFLDVTTGDFTAVPVTIVFLYLLLSVRAGIAHRARLLIPNLPPDQSKDQDCGSGA